MVTSARTLGYAQKWPDRVGVETARAPGIGELSEREHILGKRIFGEVRRVEALLL
jgi:hypothetical protein